MNVTPRQAALVDLALQMSLTPAETVYLPAIITSAARKLGITETSMLAEAKLNAPLRDYFKTTILKVQAQES